MVLAMNAARIRGGAERGALRAELVFAPKVPTAASAAVAPSVGAKLLIIAMNAATGILSARVLQLAGRGELAAMILWPVFLASALAFGLPSALTFQLRSNAEKSSRLMGAGLLLAFLAGSIGALVASFSSASGSYSIVLVPRLGIVGAGLALLLSTIVRSLFVLGSYPSFLEMRVPNAVSKVEDLKSVTNAVSKSLSLRRNRLMVAMEGVG